MPHFFEPKISNIPRPVSHSRQSVKLTVNHASKPSTDTIPLTPSRKFINNLNLNRQREPVVNKNVEKPLPQQDPEVPILELVPFGRQPYVNFGTVAVKDTQVRYVALRNLQNSQQQLFVKSFPKQDKGFNMDATEFLIAPRTEIYVAIAWTPTVVGSFREIITLQDQFRGARRIVMNGTAVRMLPNQPVAPRRVAARISPNKPLRTIRKVLTHHESPHNRHLTRLIYASRRRQSGKIVKKILSKDDDLKITTVQSYWRMILAKRRLSELREEANKKQKAAIVIQSHWKGLVARRRYNQVRNSVLKLQSNIRRLLAYRYFLALQASAKRKHQAAVTIQSRWKGLLARREFIRLRSCVIPLQARWRRVLAERQLRELRAEARRRNHAATVIQSLWRGLVARRDYAKTRSFIITLQSRWRAIIAMRELSRLKLEAGKRKIAATIFQCHWRGLVERRRYVRLKCFAIILQSNWRRVLAQRQLLKLKADAIAKHKAAVILQSHWKGLIVRRRYIQTRSSIITIQSYWRKVIALQQFARFRTEAEEKRKACIVLQSHWRGFVARHKYMKIRSTILNIQSHTRGFLVRAQLRRSIEAALKILNRSKMQ